MGPISTNWRVIFSFAERTLTLEVGVLSAFLALSHSALAAGLANELLDEGRFAEARMEAVRAARKDPGDHEARLVALTAGIRLGFELRQELESFASNKEVDIEMRCKAHLELAELYLKQDKAGEAIKHLVYCFNSTSDSTLFTLSTQRAYQTLMANPDLIDANPELVSILLTASAGWNKKLPSDKKRTAPVLARPALWAIALYRSQIGPAIGSRCSLTPSCSQYASEALKTYGARGMAMAGDRLVREPDVVAAKSKTVVIKGRLKCSDPLSDHTFWMKGKKP